MAAKKSVKKRSSKKKVDKSTNGATVGFEQELWAMADALRNNMDAAEYKHVVLADCRNTYRSTTRRDVN